MIDFADAAVQEEVLQLVVLLFGQGNKHQSAGVHVKAVHDERPRGLGESLPHGVMYVGLVVLARHGEQPGWFAHHGHLLIIIYNV